MKKDSDTEIRSKRDAVRKKDKAKKEKKRFQKSKGSKKAKVLKILDETAQEEIRDYLR